MAQATTKAAQSPPRTRKRRTLVDKLKLLALATTIVVLAKFYLVEVAVVQGNSMEPTLRAGDYVLVDKLTPRLGLVERGQIVLLVGGPQPGLLVKRVVGLSGDEVEMRWGRLLVNGEIGPAEEQTRHGVYTWGPTTVPEERLFVLGDNRPESDDSDDFGPVPAANVRGRVIAGPWRWGVPVHAAGQTDPEE
ncbi:MAG: signal peptidase I [Armatimonadota bacterium]